MAEFFPAAHYLPHDAPMVLLEHVAAVDEDNARCRVTVGPGGILAPFLDARGHLPAWYGIEIIAQTVGVWAGWHASRHNTPPSPGMLLGARDYRSQAPYFPAGACLDVSISLLMRDDRLGSFSGEIRIDGATYASGRLNTYQPDEQQLQQLLTLGRQTWCAPS